jgi:hypothetical protein
VAEREHRRLGDLGERDSECGGEQYASLLNMRHFFLLFSAYPRNNNAVNVFAIALAKIEAGR